MEKDIENFKNNLVWKTKNEVNFKSIFLLLDWKLTAQILGNTKENL